VVTREEKKEIFLYSLLDKVSKNGWSDDILSVCSEDSVLSSDEVRVFFPHGRIDLLKFWFSLSDSLMLKDLKEIEIENLKIRERIKIIIKKRLQRWVLYRSAIKKTIPLLLQPTYNQYIIFSLGVTLDLMWRVAGDKSVDFNYYTKRGLLFGVYSSTLVFLLDDSSEDFIETWNFLDRRVEEVLEIPKFKKNIDNTLSACMNNFSSSLRRFF
jgi:ubiquinone biosynthesis protein COQ9